MNTSINNKENTVNSDLSKPVILNSSELFKQRREIYIQHGEYLYQLKITRQDKLILTK